MTFAFTTLAVRTEARAETAVQWPDRPASRVTRTVTIMRALGAAEDVKRLGPNRAR
jgi:hypothetical protein